MTTILAGYKGGACVSALRPGVSEVGFRAKASERGLVLRYVPIEQAIRDASHGFKKSLRYLRRSIENELKLRAAIDAECGSPLKRIASKEPCR